TSRMASRSVWLGGPPARAIPALLTRMSSRPYSRSTQSAASRADFGSVTSSRTNRASAPASRSARSASRPRSSSRAPASTVNPRAPSWRAVSSPIPLLAPVIRAIVVVMAPTLVTGRSGRERPLVPGTGSTTHRAPGRGENEGHELEPPHRAGRVPAGQARPAEPPSGRPARGRRARAPPPPGAAPPGGSPAGRPVGGLLHPAGAGPRAAPLPSGAGRAGPGTDAHRGRARLPVPYGRRGAAAGAPAEPGDHPGHEAPARQHAGGPGLRARRGLQRAGLEPDRDPLHRRPV